ncbi:MAG: exodeoxyribonuclease III [Sedimentisphaerales bacterium]|nr:exodeoxyribonuclease III [Sedimentisphaerales bacterium]
MKIASFNVNSIRTRLPLLIEWLQKNQPDALCVQETKVQDKDFPKEAFEEIGYQAIFAGQKSYNGVAIISKQKLQKIQYGFDDEPKDQPRLIKAKLGKLNIVNTYIPQGFEPDSEKFQYKLEWFARLLNFFKKNFKPSDLLVWLGDFNIAPTDKDLYDPQGLSGSVCYHPDVHKALQKVMDFGFVDCFRLHNDQASQYTFWDYRLPNGFKRNLGWRLDHIMATKPLADKCTACLIDIDPRTKDRPSDHTPIIAEFKID